MYLGTCTCRARARGYNLYYGGGNTCKGAIIVYGMYVYVQSFPVGNSRPNSNQLELQLST